MSTTASLRTIEPDHLREGSVGGGVSEGRKLRKSVSLLGKFTSLGGLKAPGRPKRTISDFHIKLEEPHRQFQPGEFVKGSVHVTVEKELKLTHLVVNLKGNVDLFNGPTGGGVHTKKEKGPHVFDTLDEETSKLCYDEQVLCADGSLKPGVYQFQFVMLLPGKGLPSSLNFEKGKIEYKIMATITRPTAVGATLSCAMNFSVMENIDVARIEPPAPKTVSLEKKVKKDVPKDKETASTMQLQQPGTSVTSMYLPPSPPLPPSPVTKPVKAKTPKVKKRQATVSVQQGGCLRGESFTVNIKVQHIKPIKSLCGVIVTLYRVGSFDRLPLMASSKQKDKGKGKKGAISSSTVTSFRKEISQRVLPLIVDPRTLTWTGSAKLRVPEDSFPTITSVPLGIVSFRYFIEVVVDLGGKISQREELFVPVNNQPTLPQIVTSTESASLEPSLLSATIIETDRIRREKSVKSCRFEVIVGTIDSSNGRGHRIRTHTVDAPQPEQTEQPVAEITIDEPHTIPLEDHTPPELVPAPPTPDLAPSYEHHSFPIPDLPPLSEKERLQHLEASVLPSEPPCMPSSSSSSAPSAPPLEESAFYQSHPEFFAPSAPPLPTEEGSSSEPLPPTEDKRELERRRLLEAESAPPVTLAEAEPSAPVLGPDNPYFEMFVPSAPTPQEEEERIERQEGDAELPVYSR
ncbi:hypothetical protein BJ508DRAFT_179184 [Ascobolus immersus RN42]|uniref:Arrestin-like N-terminal domain-containing protein n=1 Tax=Ascobolus immersus RN42 TaxID=1160509 RepID=A0A3N4IHK6_ASCIM|nr:hypothetical protein BJ508DRAFT_179184 [Ascobolus immersus RN42]